MKTYPINEIFYSIQGEGTHAGMPAVFVRFSGCNLKCTFCDTPHELKSTDMTLEDIIAHIKEKYPTAANVIFTGGEPAMYIDEDFVSEFIEKDFYTTIETNGTLEVPSNLDWITCSPKVFGEALKLRNADEYKVLFCYAKKIEALIDSFESSTNYPAFFLQATDGHDHMKETIEYVKQNPHWKLSTQVHKLLGIE